MIRSSMLSALVLCAASVQAAPETYVIDNKHTFPMFTYNHFGYSNQTHKFSKTSGKVVIDRTAKRGSADVSIDATSIDTGIPLFNEHLQDVDFFDTARYPTITFKGSKMTFKGDVPVRLSGDLTIKGVAQPVTLTITHFKCMPHPMMKVDTCGANAITEIKRSTFGLGKYVPNVSDEVVLTMAIEAFREQPAAK